MYTLSPNENLGMQIEQVRLAQIRQEIEAGRLATDVQEKHSGVTSLIHAILTHMSSLKFSLSAKLPHQISERQITRL